MAPEECLTEDVVARFLEGVLAGAELEHAELHLSSCDSCLRIVADAGTSLEGDARDDEEKPPVSRQLGPGVEIGRYVILEQVGAGGMGRVYAAHDPALDRKVALKLLHRHAADPDLEARLLREAKTMARLEHPEVISVYDVGRFGDQLFIAMEFVEGGTLREWLAAERRPWREVLDVFTRAGRGLASAHASGVVHRDFKPDNVLVGNDGRVRVTDFGLASSAQAPAEPAGEGESPGPIDDEAPLTRTGALVGTPAYMAPEQLGGRPADARSDQYAFCVALWEALYGERPYRGRTYHELQEQKTAGAPRLASDRGVPPRLRRALLPGIRPRIEERYSSMEVLLATLARASRAPVVARVAWAVGALALVGGVALAVDAKRHAPPPGCASNAACVASHGGEPWVCRASDRACVAIASEDCTAHFEPQDLRADDTVWLGALFPAKGPNAEAFGKMSLDGADLARKEIADATRSLTGTGASVHVRPVALVACDDSVDPARAARHLVDDVGAPAIFGFSSGKEIIDVAGSFLIQRRVLTMATLTESSAITRLPQPADLPRMVWRTTNNFEVEAVAAAHFVHDALEPRVSGKNMRVALVRDNETTAILPFAERFYRTLVIDGHPAAEAGSRYSEILLAQSDPSHAAEARAVAAAPAVVVILADESRFIPFVEGLEQRWPAGVPRPTYVLTATSAATLRDFIGTDASRRARVFSVSYLQTPSTTNRFLMRFEAAHPGEATSAMNPAATYDGFYALAYATFANGAKPVTGAALATGLAHLASHGRRVESGTTDLFEGIAALSRGESIDLEGPSGELDFDPATGELTDDFSLSCAGVDATGHASSDVASGVVFVASTGRTTGTIHCP